MKAYRIADYMGNDPLTFTRQINQMKWEPEMGIPEEVQAALPETVIVFNGHENFSFVAHGPFGKYVAKFHTPQGLIDGGYTPDGPPDKLEEIMTNWNTLKDLHSRRRVVNGHFPGLNIQEFQPLDMPMSTVELENGDVLLVPIPSAHYIFLMANVRANPDDVNQRIKNADAGNAVDAFLGGLDPLPEPETVAGSDFEPDDSDLNFDEDPEIGEEGF